MKHRAIDQVMERARAAREDSDFTYFFSLLLAGEALAKIATLGMIATITEDKDRNRYRLEHMLVRTDGLGDWGRAIDDALTGPGSQYLLAEARNEQADLTRLCTEGDWQYQSVLALKSVLNHLEIEAEAVPTRTDMKRWFRLFATLRNGTRAHGATRPSQTNKAAMHLDSSLSLFYENFALFNRPWAHLHRNLSGKYRVSAICSDTSCFDYLKREPTHTLRDGIYVFMGSPRYVPLIQSDAELRDFYVVNGNFNGKRYELLSYSSNDKLDSDATPYLSPPGSLPTSETEGHGDLLPVGNCFSNMPKPAVDYVVRPQLETHLFQLLMDDRRPIVTLVGQGGIGKTSLSLKVIQQLYSERQFAAVVWFSARDIDLLPAGPRQVKPGVLSPDEMSEYFAKLVLSAADLADKQFRARAYFEKQLTKSDLGACLFVFDNFETTQNPIEVFSWIDAFIRLPNKVLITTRLREFKGDYWLEVFGMTDDEAQMLITQTSERLGIANILTTEYVESLISYSGGHPYVMKILLGEIASAGRLLSVQHAIASQDEILTALFERTYASLTPCGQRAFLTLASWTSAVPRLALEAVLLRSTLEPQEVKKGIDSLLRYSLAETYTAPKDKQEFIELPLVASVFGKKKLHVSSSKFAIQADVEMLQMLGPSRTDDVRLALANQLERFIANMSRRIEADASLDAYEPVLEIICRAYNPGWLILARWYIERDTIADYERAKVALLRFIENDPAGSDSGEAWRMLGRACYRTGDELGEIHAFVERSQLDAVSLSDISSTANLLNRLLHEQRIDVDIDQKRSLATRILRVLERRRAEADADTYSRMAWLALHLDREGKAIEFAQAGLSIDPENHYCRGIATRLGLVD